MLATISAAVSSGSARGACESESDIRVTCKKTVVVPKAAGAAKHPPSTDRPPTQTWCANHPHHNLSDVQGSRLKGFWAESNPRGPDVAVMRWRNLFSDSVLRRAERAGKPRRPLRIGTGVLQGKHCCLGRIQPRRNGLRRAPHRFTRSCADGQCLSETRGNMKGCRARC